MISWSIFLISFLLGIIFIYLSKPELKVVKIAPTPDNTKEILYKDKAGTCYEYHSHETPCKQNFFSI